MTIALILIVLFLAFSNGSNDNFKGVATIYGSGLINFKSALIWSTIFTFIGVMVSIFFADNLVKLFSGKGLVSDQAIASVYFMSSVALATGITVIVATKIGMPISTTHGIIGSLVGAGLAENYMSVNFNALLALFLLPLLLSPLISMILSFALNFIPFKKGLNEKSINTVNWVSGFFVCAMRGMNDAPKLVGMLILIPILDVKYSLLLIGIAMCIGGLINSRKIAETLSHKLAKMNNEDGMVASFTTFAMVAFANVAHLPVSTTHVNVGAIYGSTIKNNKTGSKTLMAILKAWVLTMPFAAVLAFILFKILNLFS